MSRGISSVCAPLAFYSPPLCACLPRLVGRTWHVGWHVLACRASTQGAHVAAKAVGEIGGSVALCVACLREVGPARARRLPPSALG